MIKNNLPHQKTLKDNYYLGLPINATESNPVYKTIIEKAYREITLLMARYSRIVLVRVDLHPCEKDYNIQHIELKDFTKSIKRTFEKKYNSKVAYQWVKEFGNKSYKTGIHWHLWIAVRNDKDTRPHTQSKQMFDDIFETWKRYAGGKNERNHMSGWFFLDRNHLSIDQRTRHQNLIVNGGKGLLIDINKIRNRTNNKNIALGGIIDECFYAVSYLAKVYSKVSRDSTKGSRVTACSNLNTKDTKNIRQEQINKSLEEIFSALKQPSLPPKEIKTESC